MGLGFTARAIHHRVAKGRLYPVRRGVYAVGRPELSREGRWMAAILSCGRGAALSHESAAALWGMRAGAGRIEVSVPAPRDAGRPGITVHRRAVLEVTRRYGIPVTTPGFTLVDLAARLPRDQLEAAVNEADKLRLTDPEALRAVAARLGSRPGAALLRKTLDRHTYTLTDSELERRFLRLARQAGLPAPETGRRVNQASDRRRDQVHAAAGFTTLRFTHAQVTVEPHDVKATLTAVARRLGDTGPDARAL